jgi:hypothetical protein
MQEAGYAMIHDTRTTGQTTTRRIALVVHADERPS